MPSMAGEESRGPPGGCSSLRIQGNERITAVLRMRGEPAGLERLEGMTMGDGEIFFFFCLFSTRMRPR